MQQRRDIWTRDLIEKHSPNKKSPLLQPVYSKDKFYYLLVFCTKIDTVCDTGALCYSRDSREKYI